jgi:hypothetical protein
MTGVDHVAPPFVDFTTRCWESKTSPGYQRAWFCGLMKDT